MLGYWFLTWTTYGTWLPGDRRGSTSSVWHPDGQRRRMNTPGTHPAPPQPRLESAARRQMRGPAVWLEHRQAEAAFEGVREACRFRGWTLLACAVMRNHVHVVVGVPAAPDTASVLRDLKRRASYALNQQTGSKHRWWTRSGSVRRLRNDEHVVAAVQYVREQWQPLVVWVSARARI